MGEIKKPELEKLVVGFIYREPEIFGAAKKLLTAKFGPVDFESEGMDFNYTSYYAGETGEKLKRKFLSFKIIIDPGRLAAIKIFTNSVEQKLFYKGTKKRGVNIDPGLLSLSKFVLATTKNFSHRIYIGRGIYAEITLMYRDKHYRALEWTYPDYASAAYGEVLEKIREIYRGQDGK